MKFSNLFKIYLIVILLMLLSGFGCATTQGRGASELEEEEAFAAAATTLPVTAKLRFSDVPVPAGFKLIQDKSFVFQTQGTRVALLKYVGRAKLEELVVFYKEQMPYYNWELLNVVEYGKSVLNFEREGQSCIVTIESKGRKKIVTLSVAPRAKGSIEIEDKDKKQANK